MYLVEYMSPVLSFTSRSNQSIREPNLSSSRNLSFFTLRAAGGGQPTCELWPQMDSYWFVSSEVYSFNVIKCLVGIQELHSGSVN